MIRIFVTGGTFDKTYDEIRGGLVVRATRTCPRCCGWAGRASTCRCAR